MSFSRGSLIRFLKFFGVAVAALLVLWAGYTFIMVYLIRESSLDAREMAREAPSACTDGGRDRLEPWGTGGWKRFCEKDGKKHGKLTIWQGRRKTIEGEYTRGEKSGHWRWIDNDGKVTSEDRFPGPQMDNKKALP